MNATSKAIQYKGKGPDLVKAMLDVPHGGQIIMDGRAFAAIKTQLTSLAAIIPSHPDWEAVEKFRRWPPQTCSVPVQIQSGHAMAAIIPSHPVWEAIDKFRRWAP